MLTVEAAFLKRAALCCVQQLAVSSWRERAYFMLVCKSFRRNTLESPSFLFAITHDDRSDDVHLGLFDDDVVPKTRCWCIKCCLYNAHARQMNSSVGRVLELYAKTVADGFCWLLVACTGDLRVLQDLSPSFLERNDPSVNNNAALFKACYHDHVSVVNRLLEDSRVDPAAQDNLAIRLASENGHSDVVCRLLEDSRVDPSAQHNDAIRLASKNGHLSVVHRLLEDSRVDPAAESNLAIRLASVRGRSDVVCRLLEDNRVDPSARYNHAIRLASENGYLSVVHRLLEDSRVDPSAQYNDAIRLASENGHSDVVCRLLEDSRVDPSAQYNGPV